MKSLQSRLPLIAASMVPALIEGEAGTGKEALALEVHRLSGVEGDFVRVWCGPGVAQTLEQELRQAAGGTLFLKHLPLLPASLQERLLAVLEDLPREASGRAVRPIASAVEPLEALVAAGRFVPALYFRLSACRITLPPLRERREDVAPLFAALSGGFREAGEVALPARLVGALKGYPWPGNVRELQSLARGYAALSDPALLLAELERRARTFQPPPAAGENGGSMREQVREATRRLESEIILRALDRHRWNRRRAAESLRISYRALLYKMKTCELPAGTGGGRGAP
jgi:DNA-binding NtrC family response regulator